MTTSRIQYEIRFGQEWHRVTRGAPTGRPGPGLTPDVSWLHFEIRNRDGVEVGLAKPGSWRIMVLSRGRAERRR